ncbi:hypothetical protein ES705_15417 [subsurface metagenome]
MVDPDTVLTVMVVGNRPESLGDTVIGPDDRGEIHDAAHEVQIAPLVKYPLVGNLRIIGCRVYAPDEILHEEGRAHTLMGFQNRYGNQDILFEDCPGHEYPPAP